MSNVTPFPDQGFSRVIENDFGGCPECYETDGYLNVGRWHWFICRAHKTKWCVGANLFSGWRTETEQDWQNNQQELSTFREVEPVLFDDGLEQLEEMGKALGREFERIKREFKP